MSAVFHTGGFMIVLWLLLVIVFIAILSKFYTIINFPGA